jgi:hypothetical protein
VDLGANPMAQHQSSGSMAGLGLQDLPDHPGRRLDVAHRAVRLVLIVDASADPDAGHSDAHCAAPCLESGRDSLPSASVDAPAASAAKMGHQPLVLQMRVADQAAVDELLAALLEEHALRGVDQVQVAVEWEPQKQVSESEQVRSELG